VQVLQSALERNPDDRNAHLEMAKHLLKNDQARTDLINQHLARSYTINDNNHEARHLHAQFLFSSGKVGDAWSLFQVIGTNAPPEFRQRASESPISKRLPRFQGTIATLKATMAFIKTGGYVADIFTHASSTKPEIWRALRVGDTVSFSISFNRNGPVAFDITHASI
jgi:cold shock CspA family protein